MTEKELMRIANGSDVRGVAIEGVPNEPVTLTPEAANIIAASFVTFLAKKTGKAVSDLKIAIGHDSRLSADSLKRETEFLEQFGLTPDAESLVSDEVVIPSDFNQTYAEYNRLQQEIGLDLRNYKGVSAKRDIFKLENYESDGKEYYATLLIYKDKVIGGHIGTKIYSDEYRSLAN